MTDKEVHRLIDVNFSDIEEILDREVSIDGNMVAVRNPKYDIVMDFDKFAVAAVISEN